MRSDPQNKCFHRWCRDIAKKLREGGVKGVSETTVKELIKMTLGNTAQLLGTRISMPTSSYKRSDIDLTEIDIKRKFISMEGLLTNMIAWAATDLNLDLVPDE